MTDNHASILRSVWLYGPRPDDPNVHTLYEGHVAWTRGEDEVAVRLQGPFGDPIEIVADDVHRALIGVRTDLPQDWLLVVHAARRDAWHSTTDHPCRINQVRLYPEFGQPPTAPLDALDVPDMSAWPRVCQPEEQLLYHREWAGMCGELTWSEFYATAP